MADTKFYCNTYFTDFSNVFLNETHHWFRCNSTNKYHQFLIIRQFFAVLHVIGDRKRSWQFQSARRPWAQCLRCPCDPCSDSTETSHT